MRKGQIEILERAQRYGLPEVVIEQLSREDLTLRELDNFFRSCFACLKKSNEWAKAYINLSKDIMFVIRVCVNKGYSFSVSDLQSLTDIDSICRFFSQENAICNSLDDIGAMIQLKELSCKDEYMQIMLIFARKFRKFLEESGYFDTQVYDTFYPYPVYRASECLIKYADAIDDFETFVNNIKIEELTIYEEEACIKKEIEAHLKSKYSFTLKNASGVPADLREIDFKGYSGSFEVSGYSRLVSNELTCFKITYYPFSRASIYTSGKFYTKSNSRKEKTIILFYKNDSFVTTYHTKTSTKYKPTSLKELFDAISIFDDEEDRSNAWSVVDFLCNLYGTYIFKDLYKDYLATGGFLLPCLVKEAAKYHNKQDLMVDLYHCDDLNVNLNKRNCNAVYALSKVYKRMTDEAYAKALQVDNIKFQHVGRKRYRFAFMIYNALYGTNIAEDNEMLLRDAIYEEYENKAISLLSPKTTTERHNQRGKQEKAKKIKFSIKKDTKFKTLIDNIPSEYELIRTPSRLIAETNMQHNCVALSDNYAGRIRRDTSLLYSVVFEDKRHTIEFVGNKGNYRVAQCYKACNRAASPKLLAQLRQILKQINAIA